MAHSWTIYTPLPSDKALSAIQKVFAELEKLLGRELSAAIEDDGYPEELGRWPEIEVSKTKVPTPEEERVALGGPNKIGVAFEKAALERLATCRSRIEIDRPASFEDDPTLVTAVRLLLRAVGPSVFCKSRGFDLTTSETVLQKLEKERDLPAAIRAYDGIEGGDDDDEDDDDEDEDLDDEDGDDDDGDDLEEEEEEDFEETEATTHKAIHRMLAVISEHQPTRRRVSEALERATPEVQAFARYLAQRGPTTDSLVAHSLDLDVKVVGKARRALADLLERAERRR